MMRKLDMYCLAVKYYFQGDSWKDAVGYAKALTMGFKKVDAK